MLSSFIFLEIIHRQFGLGQLFHFFSGIMGTPIEVNEVLRDVSPRRQLLPHGWRTLDTECKGVLSVGE